MSNRNKCCIEIHFGLVKNELIKSRTETSVVLKSPNEIREYEDENSRTETSVVLKFLKLQECMSAKGSRTETSVVLKSGYLWRWVGFV